MLEHRRQNLNNFSGNDREKQLDNLIFKPAGEKFKRLRDAANE
jgi:hypothetical protein